MVSKKEMNPNNHEKKKKRGKNKRHLLTSMTYHIKEKHVDGEPEELPEDGIGESAFDNHGEIKETIVEDKNEELGNQSENESELKSRLNDNKNRIFKNENKL